MCSTGSAMAERHRRNELEEKRNRRENWRTIYELYLPANPLMDEHSWEGTKWLDLLVENDEERDYYVRTKKRLSAFYPTDLEFLLRQLDVDNIVITGTYTDACDLSTAFDAANRDYRVIVPRDIVAGYDQEAEDAALLIISLVLGLVVDSPALLREYYARKGKDPRPGEPRASAVGRRRDRGAASSMPRSAMASRSPCRRSRRRSRSPARVPRSCGLSSSRDDA